MATPTDPTESDALPNEEKDVPVEETTPAQTPVTPPAEEVSYVLGIDLGSENAVATLTSTKSVKPEILRNDISLQSTPVCVAFNGKERSFGSLGLQLETTHKDNTIRGVLRSIGKTTDEFAQEAPWCACKVVEGDSGLCFEVAYNSKSVQLKPEQVYATFLAKLASFAEASVKEKFVVSVVVPDEFDQEQLAAIKRACEIAGVEAVQLITRGAAVCMAYGTRKTEAVLDGSVTLFVDVGHAYVTAAVYKWEGKKAKHIITKTSNTLGSYRIDQVIFQELSKDCKAKYGEEVKPGSKGGIRLLKLCKKLKESLSAVPEAEGTCENLLDQDIRFTITRDRVLSACTEMKEELQTLFTEAVEASEEPISVCELIGGGMRVPMVKEAISAALQNKISLSYTLDSMAAPAAGASYSGVTLYEPVGVRRPAFDNLCSIVDNHGIYDVTKVEIGVDQESLNVLVEEEANMRQNDRDVVALSAARNKLESFVFETRSAATGGRKFGELIDKDSCLKILDDFEEWMYTEEAENGTVETYESKLADIKLALGPSCQAYLDKVEETRLQKERELEEISKKAAEELEASGGKDDHDFRKLSKPDRMKKVVMNKEEGTSLFKDGNFEAASLRYKRSLQHCDKFFDLSKEDEEEVDTMKHTLHLNIAMCHIKLEAWEFGLKSCNQALELNGESTKALYRRAVILEKTKDFDKAKVDLLAALKKEPEDKSLLRLLDRVNAQIKREKLKQKKMAQKMFG